MGRRDAEYVLVRSRKPKKTRQYYYDDDDDDDDDDGSVVYRRTIRRKPRNRYISSEEIDSDYRREKSSDPRIKVQRTSNGDQVILDEDDNIIKVIRNSRSPSPVSIDNRRLKYRPRESQSVFYETSDGHIRSRPSKKNILHTKKTQVMYDNDTPTRVLKRVIIDPRTGDRKTIYEKDKPRRQQKFFLHERPAEQFIDSDDSDEQQPTQYVRTVKHRTIPTEVLPRQEPRYFMIKKRSDSEPVYALRSKMPTIQSNRRVFHEAPSKKPITTYIYPTNGKYYK